MDRHILGVIGGLGPMATAYFMRLVTDMTDASCDQEHIEQIILSRPSTPDRTSFILGTGKESPLPELIRMEDDVCRLGASVIAMPCITAHYFQKELVNNLKQYDGVTLIDGIGETAAYLKDKGITSCGIMATDGTVKSNLFQDAFSKAGIESVIPDDKHQSLVMDIIYNNVKKGMPINTLNFDKVTKHLKSKGAHIVLLGCTELSMAKRDNDIPADVLDVLDVLARKSVIMCGRLKSEYNEIITK